MHSKLSRIFVSCRTCNSLSVCPCLCRDVQEALESGVVYRNAASCSQANNVLAVCRSTYVGLLDMTQHAAEMTASVAIGSGAVYQVSI